MAQTSVRVRTVQDACVAVGWAGHRTLTVDRPEQAGAQFFEVGHASDARGCTGHPGRKVKGSNDLSFLKVGNYETYLTRHLLLHLHSVQ